MKKLIACLAGLFAFGLSANAQILQFTFNNQSQAASVTATTIDPNATATDLTRTVLQTGDGTSFSTATNFLVGGGGTMPTNATPSLTAYVSFTITPNAGYAVNLSSFNLSSAVQDGGMVDVQYSTDNFATSTDLGSFAPSSSPQSPSSTSLPASLSDDTSPVQFRIYFMMPRMAMKPVVWVSSPSMEV